MVSLNSCIMYIMYWCSIPLLPWCSVWNFGCGAVWQITVINESKPSLKPFGVISGCPNRNQAVWFVSRNLQTETANSVLVLVQTEFESVWNQTSPTLVPALGAGLNHGQPLINFIKDVMNTWKVLLTALVHQESLMESKGLVSVQCYGVSLLIFTQ